jgi:hypothetical protein
MSIDQCRKKAMRGCRTFCNDGGYITIQDGLGHNDPWSLSAGHSVDRTDPDLFKKGWINDPDLERGKQTEIAKEYGGRVDYTRE